MKDSIQTPKGVEKLYKSNTECYGCGACEQACAVGCITMKPDSEGFLYPVIDNDKCSNCDMCVRVCPIKKQQKNNITPTCFVGYSTDKNTRQKSSSGGIFPELATEILNRGGVVFGCGYTDDFSVVCTEIDNPADIKKLQGSKYVQSAIGDSYKRVKKFLNENRLVYFSGTPCQIKGLYTYLNGKEIPNLITQDIVCHGVPSPLVWKKYVELMKKKGEIQNISFRDKGYGWKYFSMLFKYKEKTYRKRLDVDRFLRLFLDNTILRPVCHICPMKAEGSCADISLADCWGAHNVIKKLKDDDLGLSLILVHTDKGLNLWNSLSDKVCAEKIDTDKALKSQSAITKPSAMNPKRNMFFESLGKEDFDVLIKRWYNDSPSNNLKKYYVYIKTKIYMKLKNR